MICSIGIISMTLILYFLFLVVIMDGDFFFRRSWNIIHSFAKAKDLEEEETFRTRIPRNFYSSDFDQGTIMSFGETTKREQAKVIFSVDFPVVFWSGFIWLADWSWLLKRRIRLPKKRCPPSRVLFAEWVTRLSTTLYLYSRAIIGFLPCSFMKVEEEEEEVRSCIDYWVCVCVSSLFCQ